MLVQLHATTVIALAAIVACTPDAGQDALAPHLTPGFTLAGSGPWADGHANVTQAPGVLRTFSFTAREMPDGTVEGEFVNHNRLGDIVNHGDIDCLQVVDNVAVLSGPITKHTNPALEGFRTIFRVVDNGEAESDLPDEVSVLLNRPPGTTLDCHTVPGALFVMQPVEGGNVQVSP